MAPLSVVLIATAVISGVKDPYDHEGLSPSRVCIGHSDNSAADYRMGLVKRGYYLGMDNLPRGGPAAPGTPLAQPGSLTFEQRMVAIKDLVDAGFAQRVMLGNDHSIAMSLQPTAADKLRLAQNPDGILSSPARCSRL